MVFRNQDLGAECAHCHRGATAARPSYHQLQGMYVRLPTQVYARLCNYIVSCVSAQTLKTMHSD